MNKSLLTILFFIGIVSFSYADPLIRSKRSLWQLDQVMQCATQLSNYDVFSTYNCHGCYCGKGGSGTPIDDIDQCCQAHDNCYSKFNQQQTFGCMEASGQIYWDTYQFNCTIGDIDLPTPTGKMTRRTPQCTYGRTACARGGCECDVAFANCIRKFKLVKKQSCSTTRLLCLNVKWWPSDFGWGLFGASKAEKTEFLI